MLTPEERQVLESIDRDVAAKGIPIPFRPMHGLGRFARHFGLTIDGKSALEAQILAWFEARYGDRLVGCTLLGRLPVEIRGDIFYLSLAPALEKEPGGKVVPMLKWGISVGERLQASLTQAEWANIHDLLDMGQRAFSELAPHVCERVLSADATHDLDIALDELLRPDGPRAGLSKWASLQAAEKSLKEFIRRHGSDPPKSHDIFELHDLAVSYGVPQMRGLRLPEGEVLNLVQCSAGVRYGEEAVSPHEAVGAYYGALIICSGAAARLRVENGGRCWLYLDGKSPGGFVFERLAELAGVPHDIEF